MSAWPIPLLGDIEDPSFKFEGDCSKDLKINNIDQLAAKLLTLSSQSPGEEEEDGSSESEININLPHSSSSNTRSSPDVISSGKSEGDPEEESGPNVRFKTEICRNFKEKGHCLYGDLCQFAHGKDEMRNVGQHSKYKTKRCQKYWIAGYCAYGPRCNFLHYEEKDSTGPLTIKQTSKAMSGSLESGYNTPGPSLSPLGVKSSLPSTPVALDILYRPCVGSGRLAAFTRNGEYHWIDTRTQRYV